MIQNSLDPQLRADIDRGIYGQIIARHVSAEDYMAEFAADFREWVDGFVIDIKYVTIQHQETLNYVRNLVEIYLDFNPIGCTLGFPFVLQLDKTNSRREPDFQVLLEAVPGAYNDRRKSSKLNDDDEIYQTTGGILTNTAMIGSADICVEIVTDESLARDYSLKYHEYAAAGVKEYWCIDPVRKNALLYRLNNTGSYTQQTPDSGGFYRTPLLPDFRLHVPTMWVNPLPNIFERLQMVEAMMKKPSE